MVFFFTTRRAQKTKLETLSTYEIMNDSITKHELVHEIKGNTQNVMPRQKQCHRRIACLQQPKAIVIVIRDFTTHLGGTQFKLLLKYVQILQLSGAITSIISKGNLIDRLIHDYN